MKLSNGEKLILMMLCELYEKLGIKGEIDPKFIQEAIWSGNQWGLTWKYPGIFDSEPRGEAAVSEVCDILEMWWLMESAYADLSAEDKKRIASEVGPLGENVRFLGFDGNNETEHLGVARFLIERLDRFAHFKGRDLNSHMPSLDIYGRMLAVYKTTRSTLADRRMGADEIIALLKAKIHPSRR
jgi:uncharacterized protein YfbU (UPF0304 family)